MNVLLEKLRKMPARYIYGIIALLSLAFTNWKSGHFGLWVDEFAQICYSGLDKTIWDSLLIVDPTPPLFNVVANIWYDITPYGDRWLLLLPQLAMALAVYTAGLWGEVMGGRRLGFWMASLLGFSRMVITICGFEFRTYGFYLLFATLALYSHSLVLREGAEAERKTLVFYGLSLFALIYSHLFGALIFAGLAVVDILLMLSGRMSWKRLLPYFCSGPWLLPWLIRFLALAGKRVLTAPSGWMAKPSGMGVARLVAYLCGNHYVACLLFAFGVLAVLWQLARELRKKKCSPELIQRITPLVVMAFMILVVFAYGKIRSENKSLWVERYFTGLFSCVIALCAMGVDGLARLLERKLRWAAVGLQLLCYLLIIPVFLGRVASGDIPMEKYYHRESTEVMYQQADIHDESTLVLTTISAYAEGWEEYYCERKGAREPIGLTSVFAVSEEELLRHDVVYLDFGREDAYSMNAPGRQALEENYEIDRTWDEVYLRRYVKKQ